jgi:hypothetical protein
MAQNDVGFSGSIPQLCDQELGKVLFTPYAVDLARRLQSRNVPSVLETAVGTPIAFPSA